MLTASGPYFDKISTVNKSRRTLSAGLAADHVAEIETSRASVVLIFPASKERALAVTVPCAPSAVQPVAAKVPGVPTVRMTTWASIVKVSSFETSTASVATIYVARATRTIEEIVRDVGLRIIGPHHERRADSREGVPHDSLKSEPARPFGRAHTVVNDLSHIISECGKSIVQQCAGPRTMDKRLLQLRLDGIGLKVHALDNRGGSGLNLERGRFVAPFQDQVEDSRGAIAFVPIPKYVN